MGDDLDFDFIGWFCFNLLLLLIIKILIQKPTFAGETSFPKIPIYGRLILFQLCLLILFQFIHVLIINILFIYLRYGR